MSSLQEFHKRFFSRPVLSLSIFLFVWAIAFSSAGYDGDLPQGYDSALYLLLGKSFSQGTGYEDLTLPGNQNAFKAPSAMPLLLSVWWRSGLPLAALKILIYVLMASGACAVFLGFRQLIGTPAAFAIALAFSCTRYFILIANSTLTEALFIPALYGGFYLALKAESDSLNPAWGWAALAMFLVLSRTRVAGLFFLGGFLFRRLQVRDFRKVAAGAGLFALWLLYERSLLVPGKESAGYFSGLSGTYPIAEDPAGVVLQTGLLIWKNTVLFCERLYGEILFRSAYYLLPQTGWLDKAMIPLAGIGVWGLVRLGTAKNLRWWVAGAVLSLIPVMTWRSQGTLFRYFFPLFPLLSAAFVYPFYRWGLNAAQPRKKSVFVLIALFILGNQLGYTFREYRKGSFAPDAAAVDLKALHDRLAVEKKADRMILSPCHYYTVLRSGAYAALSTFPREACRGISSFSQGRLEIILPLDQVGRFHPLVCGQRKFMIDSIPPIRAGGQGLYLLSEVRP